MPSYHLYFTLGKFWIIVVIVVIADVFIVVIVVIADDVFIEDPIINFLSRSRLV